MSLDRARWRWAISRAWTWFREGRTLSVLLGICLRPAFQKKGVIQVLPGWPFPTVLNRGRIEIGNCSLFPGVRIECWPGAHITIGNGTYLNRNTEIVAAGAITIGCNCMIARDVLIMDTDQHALPGRQLEIRPVSIGDRVWIGARAIILKGVNLGSDAIVGAGAIVTNDVPPGTVVVGPSAHELTRLNIAGPHR